MIAKIFDQKYRLLAIGTLLLLGALIYSNTFFSSFHFDDTPSIVENPAIRNILNLPAIWNSWPTRFVTYLSLALNYRLGQLNVFSYHLFNFLVHICTAIMVWWFALLTFSTPAMRGKKIAKHAGLIAFFIGLVFMTHPIQTQAVTYIVQRAASLATLFYLACLCLYIKSRLLQQQGENIISSRISYCCSLIVAIMAMFTKEITVTLPLMVLFYEYFFLRIEKKFDWKHPFPFFATMLVVPLTMFFTSSVDFMGMRRSLEPASGISPWQYLITQFRVMVTYIRLLFIPVNQNLDYDYCISKSLLELPVLSSLVILASISTLAFKASSKYKLISFGIFWFFLTLLPESSVIPIKDVIYEHRLYLPMVGFSFFLVSGIYHIFENKNLKLAVIVLLVITSCYAILSYKRNFVWENELTLWDDAAHKSPQKARPYNNRGNAYAQGGNLPQAISDYTMAIGIDRNYADAYYNRGNAYDNQSNFTQAISDYTKAIEINPRYAKAYNNRGVTYGHEDNLPQAISDYTRAIGIDHNYADAYYNRGNAYDDQGSFAQAILNFTRAIEINPKYADAYYNRGSVYSSQRKFPQAILDYTRAIEIDPNRANAYNNRGVAYRQEGNLPQAISDCTRAIEINPGLSEAYNNRGVAYGQQGNLSQAISDFTRAIKITPKNTEAYCNRVLAYEELKKASGRDK